MKINVTIQELIEFIAGASNVDEVKETVAGAFAAIATDPIIEDALRKRITAMGEAELRKIVEAAIGTTGYGNNMKVTGWAADIVRQHIAAELGSVSISQAIKDAVQNELIKLRADRAKMVEEVQSIVESILVREMPKHLEGKYAERVAERYDAESLRKLVSEEVNSYMRKAFK